MILRRLAQPLLGAIFVWGGINALRNLEGHTQVTKPLLDKVPAEPEKLVKGDALVKLGAGLALGFGFLPRFAAVLLTGSLVPTTLAAHRFWELDDEEARGAQQIQFLKNLGLLGGLLLASARNG